MGDHARITREAQYIYETAPLVDQRTGQLLFNFLRHEIAEVVRDTNLDTFYEQLSFEDIVDWLDNHIVYAIDGRMVRLVDHDNILWEEEYDAA